MEEYEKIELRSEEIQEILGTPPRWIVRWGTTIAFLTFCALLFAGYFIRYPDIIKAPITLASANPPMEIISPVNTNALTLNVKNGQKVKEGDILGKLDGLANYNDVFFLEEQLRLELEAGENNSFLDFKPAPYLELGILQPSYNRLIKNFESYKISSTSNYAAQNIQSLNNQIKSLQHAIQANNDRKPNIEEELNAAETAVDNIQKRYVNNPSLIGDLQKAVFLANSLKTSLKNLEAENAQKLVEISNLQTQIRVILSQSGTDISNSLVTIKSDMNSLLTEIENWKKDNILVAPKAGTVVINEKIIEKQSVRENEKILSIVPEDDKDFYGKVLLPIKGSGKVLEGQEVVIKFDKFPYKEYGTVKGVVESKSILPNDNVQNIIVNLDTTLTTNQNKKLTYTPLMQGTAEIITKNRRFIERVFENVTAFLEEH